MVRIKVFSLSKLLGLIMCAVLLLVASGFTMKAMEFFKLSQEYSFPAVALAQDKQEDDGTQSGMEAQDTQVIEENEHDPGYDADESIKIEIAGIHVDDVPKKTAPRVLIYHTHTYEAYEQVQDDLYVEAYSAQWRTMDTGHNIVRVGEELTRLLTDYGFEVVHDTTEFEPPRLGTAYVRSLEMLEDRMASGEQYDLIIDMHRDSYSASSWTPESVEINGEQCARLMFLVGTGEDGFTVKPNWQENYALSNQLIESLQSVDPLLCKDANVKTQRYNQHVSTRCVLVEVGHCENTLDEALASMKYLAEAINDTLRSSDGE